jgi:hypothetical protein
MYKYFFLIVLTFLTTSRSKAQSIFFNDSILIQTKIWSRDSNRKIQYSDWKSFSSRTVEMLDGFVPEKKIKSSKYGGDANIKLNASGYFRTEKVNGRWSVIDPDGHPFIVSAMNSFRQGKSPNNEKAFNEKFGSVNKWVDVSIQTFQNLHFL